MFLSKSAFAKETSTPIQLIMKPTICVLSEKESHCEDVLIAEWKADNNKNYSLCLFQHDNSSPIKCWKDVNFGATTFTRSIATTTIFELRDSNNQMLSQQAFQVINAQKKFQRSRRNPWSFF